MQANWNTFRCSDSTNSDWNVPQTAAETNTALQQGQQLVIMDLGKIFWHDQVAPREEIREYYPGNEDQQPRIARIFDYPCDPWFSNSAVCSINMQPTPSNRGGSLTA
jgi:hypothetical protein